MTTCVTDPGSWTRATARVHSCWANQSASSHSANVHRGLMCQTILELVHSRDRPFLSSLHGACILSCWSDVWRVKCLVMSTDLCWRRGGSIYNTPVVWFYLKGLEPGRHWAKAVSGPWPGSAFAETPPEDRAAAAGPHVAQARGAPR